MQKFKWVNRFHNTKAASTLTEKMVENIYWQIYQGYINSKHPDYRKLKVLENKLCNSKGCCCGSFTKQIG